MSRDYNMAAHMGVTDQDIVELRSMPEKIAHTADVHLWMTYDSHLLNVRADTPENTQRLLEDHFMTMRIQVSPRHWAEMTVSANFNLGGELEPEWYMNDDYLFRCCKECYESNPPTK